MGGGDGSSSSAGGSSDEGGSSDGGSDSSSGEDSRCDCTEPGTPFEDCTDAPLTDCGSFELVCDSLSDDSTCEEGPPSADELAMIDCMIGAANDGTAASLHVSRGDEIGQFSDSRWIVLLGDGTAMAGGVEYQDIGGQRDATRFTDAPGAAPFTACRDRADAIAVHACLVDITFAGEPLEYCDADPF